MKALTRTSIKFIVDEMDAEIKKVLAKHGVKFNNCRVSFTSDSFRYSVTANVIPTGVVNTSRLGGEMTEEYLEMGLAKLGQRAWIYDEREAKAWLEVEITAVRRTKYAFTWVKYPEDQRMIANFSAFRLTDPDKLKMPLTEKEAKMLHHFGEH